MKRLYSVFNIVKLQKHTEMQKHYLLPKGAFHFIVMGYSFFKHTFFFIKHNFFTRKCFSAYPGFFSPEGIYNIQ